MISWLQNLLQKHYKWLFSGLLAIIIVAFVFTIGNTGGIGSSNPQDIKMEFFGVNLNSPREKQAIEQDVILSAELNGQQLNRNSFQGAFFQRITALYLANQLNMPGPNDAQMAEYIRGLPAFQDRRTGSFSPDLYTKMLDSMQNSPQRGGEQALLQVISDDYRIGKVMGALGGPGYVLPYMAKRQIEMTDTVWDVSVAEFDQGGFKPDLQPTDENLQKFYEENEMRFATGPRIVVSYVGFPTSEFVGDVDEPTEAQQLNYYRVHRNEFPKGEDGKPQPIDAVRADVIAGWKKTQAQELAINAANELAVAAYEAVYAEKLEPNAQSVAAFAKEHGKKLVTLAPFSRSKPESSVPGVPQSALAQAAGLDDARFYTDAVALDDGAAIFFLEEELPSSTPALADIREQVLEDYKTSETRRLYNLRALEIKKELQAAATAGKSFKETAESLGLTVQSYSDFTFNSPPQGLDYFVLQTIQGMKVGEVEDLMAFGSLGTYIYVSGKETPDVPLDSPKIEENVGQMTTFAGRATAQGILNELITQEEARVVPQEF